MKLQLKEGAGFPNSLLYMLAVIAGVSVPSIKCMKKMSVK